jgi:methionyl-tRNA formyltransferase
MNIAFIGRGRVGHEALKKLMLMPDINIKFIVTCKFTEEVEVENEVFEEIAKELDIPYHHTNNINTIEWERKFHGLELVAAMLWFNTIDEKIIKSVKYGFLNLHGGLLPRYRGNACSNWSIINGEKKTGVTIHLMEGNKLDSGNIVLQSEVDILETDYIMDIHRKIEYAGIDLLIKSVELFQEKGSEVNLKEQNETNALRCYPRIPTDGEIDWKSDGEIIHRLIRASSKPYPGAYTLFKDNRDDKIKKMIIWEADLVQLEHEYCAMPGHLIKNEKGNYLISTGSKFFIRPKKTSINGEYIFIDNHFKTIRQRLGLTTSQILL